MKRLLFAILLAVLVSTSAWGAGACNQSVHNAGRDMRRVAFSCTGDASDGSIPDTDTDSNITSKIMGWYLIKIIADPGTTAPDAADVLVKDTGAEDMLEGDGVNQIHATNTQSIYPADASNLHISRGIPILGTITLDVDNQATASATYVITLVFAR